jgi:hypothetical protein
MLLDRKTGPELFFESRSTAGSGTIRQGPQQADQCQISPFKFCKFALLWAILFSLELTTPYASVIYSDFQREL